jgi:hypothetical protein
MELVSGAPSQSLMLLVFIILELVEDVKDQQ